MNTNWLHLWETRFSEAGYAYGEAPNEYLRMQLANLPPGKILFGAEGEGRNAVHAAQLGWTTSAFDISQAGKRKAEQLAQKHRVTLDYRIGQLPDLDFADASFDALVLIYAHFPPAIRSQYHRILAKKLKSGGTIIFEGFGENHLPYRTQNPQVGGPGNLELLFSVSEIEKDFSDFKVLELEEKEVELREGAYHNGKGSVVRFVGRKK